MNPYWMSGLARSSGDLKDEVEEVAHLALADAGLCLGDLAMNLHLSRTVWRRVWDAVHSRENYKDSMAEAIALAGRPLAPTEVEHVARTDARASVLAELTRWNALNEMALERALSRASVRKSSSGASSLLLQPGLPEDRVDELAEALNLEGLLRVVAFAPTGRLDRSWTIARLVSLPFTRSQGQQRNRLVQLALLRDPDLAEVAAKLVPTDRGAAQFFSIPLAGSRNGLLALEAEDAVPRLIEAVPPVSKGFTLMAIVGNPAASEQLLQEIASGRIGGYGSRASSMATFRLSGASNAIPAGVDVSSDDREPVLSLCAERSLPGGMFNSSGRPERMLLLGRNPHLGDETRRRITSEFAAAIGFKSELWLSTEADAVLPGWRDSLWWGRRTPLDPPLVRMFDEIGADRAVWGSILRLGAGWSGTMPDLLATARLV